MGRKKTGRKPSALVRVDTGTAKLLMNLRGKFRDKATGDQSVDLVVRALWRDSCELNRLKHPVKENVKNAAELPVQH